MTRVSKICVVGGAMAALTLAANSANAGTLNIHTSTPQVKVKVPPPPTVGGTKSMHVITPSSGKAFVGRNDGYLQMQNQSSDQGFTRSPWVEGRPSTGFSNIIITPASRRSEMHVMQMSARILAILGRLVFCCWA